MKQLSLLDVVLNMLFVLTLILKLITLDTSSKFHSLIFIDFIDLRRIFRDNNVILLSIPSYFENTDSPIVCYKYNKHIPNALLNFNELVSDLDIVIGIPDS